MAADILAGKADYSARKGTDATIGAQPAGINSVITPPFNSGHRDMRRRCEAMPKVVPIRDETLTAIHYADDHQWRHR